MAEGGLWQLAGLAFNGYVAMAAYVVLKTCEHSLSDGTQGQDLIDELRRSGHLGLGTVVLMLSS